MEAYDGDARHHDADDVRAARPQMNTATRLQQQQQFVAATHATVLFARVVIRVRSEHLGMKQAGMHGIVEVDCVAYASKDDLHCTARPSPVTSQQPTPRTLATPCAFGGVGRGGGGANA